ncbi:exocyst complex component EXO84C-like [Rutidosis leptorrhynchoides]|uniref:exocyst complex component EXO84C-like n=1 Tax=Rutidosis leptorrhynchoides TaxID=125765 RepID=UPI003A99D997
MDTSEEEEEDDFPSIESVTPQSKIDTIYQSKTEKGIRKLCFELLDLKDAVENLCGNTQSKYLAFLRLSEEVSEMEHELNELRKSISAQGILVQDLLSGVYHELGEWSKSNPNLMSTEQLQEDSEFNNLFSNEAEDENKGKIDAFLAEHRVEQAIEAIDAEEKKHPELKNSSYKSDFLKRKSMLENQLIKVTEQTLVSSADLKMAVSGLLKLGKGTLAHQLLLKAKGARLQKSINLLLPSCSCYPETFPATLSNLVFSTISSTTKEMSSMFGDDLVYHNKVVQWAEKQIELFVRLVKENAPSSETVSALHAASICVQASLNHCSALELQGLKLSKVLLVLLEPYIEEVLELNFRRARKLVFDFSANDEILPLSPRLASPLSTFAISSDGGLLVDSGTRFIFMVKDIVDQLTHLVILHFGGNVLTRILQLFDQYMDELIKALPEPSEDDSLVELKESVPFKAETDSQQLALLGTAFTIAEELLPMVMSRIWSILNEIKEAGNGDADNNNNTPIMNGMIDYKDWRKQLQHSLDKLRDHFCRQYVLNFIYSRDGKTRPDAHIYLCGDGDDNWNTDPLPSLPFQALFGKLQQLATVAGDVLLGKEKIQKVLLARLTETVVMWLMSNEEDFWGVLENEVSKLQPQGLQQLILDMHFTVEIARFAGYPSRNVHQMASSIIARAIRTFSGRGLNEQSVLPEDEWFVETAKAAINKLLMGGDDGSETSEIDEDHIILHDDDDDDDDNEIHDEVISDSDESPSSLSSITTSESFASAESQMLDSLSDFTDPES